MTGVTNGGGTAYSSGAPEFAPVFLIILVELVLSYYIFSHFSSVMISAYK
jgi:hypothetical protein